MQNEDFDSEPEETIFKDCLDAIKDGDVGKAAEASTKIWEMVAEHTEEDNPWLKSLETAHECEAAFDWDGAVAAYRTALQIAGDSPGRQYRAYDYLSRLYGLLGRDEPRLNAALKASHAAREADLSPITILALNSEATLHLRAGNLAKAKELIDEALASLAEDVPSDLQRAFLLLTRADYFMALDEQEPAKADLDAAYALVWKQEGIFFAAGFQSAIAGYWSSTAQLHDKNHDYNSAVHAWQQAVDRRRIISQLPQLEGPYKHNNLATGLRNLGRAQLKANDPAAHDSFAESDSIRKAIGLEPLPK